MPTNNILFLMTDQHRADHVGWHPAARVKTPNLDRLADIICLGEHRNRVMRHREYLEFIKDRYQPAQTCWAELSPVGGG
jgi:hypothetical protein